MTAEYYIRDILKTNLISIVYTELKERGIQKLRSSCELYFELNPELYRPLTNENYDKITKLISLSLKINIFTFNSKHYKQTNGSPMGSPLYSPLAEIVMRHIDQTIISRFPNIIQTWKRYIDDIFCICQTDKINNILTEINSLHNELNFIIEKENNNSLPFLDILITKTTHCTLPQYITSLHSNPISYNIHHTAH
ncbi:ACSF2 [Cordylochernes scorpioides]|uniref:ACSF2 n=1 Tax=Cordylochernes scorpioides TaxID=51811 RepID=A0ABY6KSV5_9ARAC|nr:ACSF2 [Cordylochernes scorpioides]